MAIATVEISSTDKSEKALPHQKPTKNAFLNTNDSTFTELVQCHIYEFAPMTFRINSTDMPAILQTRIWWHPHHRFFFFCFYSSGGVYHFSSRTFWPDARSTVIAFLFLEALTSSHAPDVETAYIITCNSHRVTFLFLNCFTVDTSCNKCGFSFNFHVQ